MAAGVWSEADRCEYKAGGGGGGCSGYRQNWR